MPTDGTPSIRTITRTADVDAEISRKLDAILDRLASPPQRFLTVRSAASYADLSEDSIRRLIESGRLSVYRPVKGRLLVDRLELDNLILASTGHPRNGRGMVSHRSEANGDAP